MKKRKGKTKRWLAGILSAVLVIGSIVFLFHRFLLLILIYSSRKFLFPFSSRKVVTAPSMSPEHGPSGEDTKKASTIVAGCTMDNQIKISSSFQCRIGFGKKQLIPTI